MISTAYIERISLLVSVSVGAGDCVHSGYGQLCSPPGSADFDRPGAVSVRAIQPSILRVAFGNNARSATSSDIGPILVRREPPPVGMLEAMMVAAERTHIRRDRFTAAFGVAMMERFIVVQIGIPGRDITM